jgi:hypothetical protein
VFEAIETVRGEELKCHHQMGLQLRVLMIGSYGERPMFIVYPPAKWSNQRYFKSQ